MGDRLRFSQFHFDSWHPARVRGIMPPHLPTHVSTIPEDPLMAKTSCPITRTDFQGKAKPVSVTIANVPFVAEVKEFSTGSLGWYLNSKVTLDVAGRRSRSRSA